jgi:hypothetical protein
MNFRVKYLIDLLMIPSRIGEHITEILTELFKITSNEYHEWMRKND